MSDTPSSALAASAAVTPGTTSTLIVVPLEKLDLFLRAAEEHRVAALQPHHHAVAPRRVGEALVDEVLRRRMPAATLADGDLFGAERERQRLRMNQSVVENDVGLAEQPGRAQGKEVRCAGSGADEVDGAGLKP